jgi:multidrug transporter EmrE-like cation transporter
MRFAQEHAHHSGRSLAVVAATPPRILGRLAILGCSAMAWLFTLSPVPLCFPYPFNALGDIGLLTASVLFLNKGANARSWLGTLLVAAGLTLVATTAPG